MYRLVRFGYAIGYVKGIGGENITEGVTNTRSLAIATSHYRKNKKFGSTLGSHFKFWTKLDEER